MKRHIAKDIALALLPLLLFIAYAYPSFYLQRYSAFYYDYSWLTLFNTVAPALVGVILCAILIYAWINRASTVFISLFCGAFLLNSFLALCSAGVIEAVGNLYLGRTVFISRLGGVELARIIAAIYTVMFWVSLVCFLQARKKNRQA